MSDPEAAARRIERANQQAEELIRGLDERIDRLEQLYTRLIQTNETEPPRGLVV